VEQFLVLGCSPSDLADFSWIQDKGNQDKFIPDPPNKSNPANFAPWLGGHVVTQPEQAEVPSPKRPPWSQFWK
jgi:hypothetical protein